MDKNKFVAGVELSDSDKLHTLHFQYTFGDLEYFGYVSSWLPNNKLNRRILMEYKYQNQRDYIRTEYDCNGSVKKVIKLETDTKRNKIRVKCWCSVDC